MGELNTPPFYTFFKHKTTNIWLQQKKQILVFGM
jgi:hypothetical protein